MLSKKLVRFALLTLVNALGFYMPYAFGGGSNISEIAGNVTSNLVNIAKLLTAGAYVAGFGLTIGALFKFKQHKDNPQQVQFGTCITMLIIGVCLIFLPSVISIGGGTLGSLSVGSVGGFTTFGGNSA